jgi:hypothetical protein
MKSVVFRIRKEYFDAIVSGDKTVEYRKNSPYWQKRLLGMTADEYAEVIGFADSTFPFKDKPREPMVAVFVCGKRIHRREIMAIERLKTPSWFSSQGQRDVDTETCFAIHLGSVYRGKTT